MASKTSSNWPAIRRSKTSTGRNGSPETRKCPPGRGSGFSKKGGGVLCKTTQVKYAMIKANKNQFPVGMMCRMVSVSRSGYYDWKHRPHSDRDKANQFLANEIKRVFDDEKGRPSSPRMTRRLQEEGKSLASRHRVARIMQINGWRAKAAKKYKATTNSNHSLPVAPNLLEQNFTADAPDQKWVSDINLYLDGRRLAVFSGCA